MRALSFEKDGDRNGHIDFITAASVCEYSYKIKYIFLVFLILKILIRNYHYLMVII